jgi:hypothetical protein
MAPQAGKSQTLGLRIPTAPLKLICFVVLGIILVAGLWPFRAPKNEVSWMSSGNGLLFGDYGSIVSAGVFKANRSQADSSWSLEIWLEPSRVDSSGTILAFYWPESRVVPFALQQSLGDLLLQSTRADPLHHARKTKMYVDDVFSSAKPVLITISSGASGTTVYADGKLMKRSSNFRLSNQDLTGRLIIGNAPATTHTWSGQLKGVAVYDRELTAVDVAQHYASWTNSEQKDLAESKGAVARYTFNETNGNIVHNQLNSATDLLIPERFFVLRERFLEPFWEEFYGGWSYWKDVGINIAGFIPLGLVFYAYFLLVRRIEHPAAVTVALGFAVSLTIEVLQAFLPTRNSGTTDLITNTFGTAVGVILCQRLEVQLVLARTALYSENSNVPFIAGSIRSSRCAPTQLPGVEFGDRKHG